MKLKVRAPRPGFPWSAPTVPNGVAPLEEERAAYLRMQEHMLRNPVTEESLLKLAASPAAVAEGAQIFKAICTQCHLSHGGGSNSPLSIGPNLTDGFWINGGSPLQIHHTIMHGGREGKGMQSWAVNGPVFVQNATAYVLSIRNTNVKGGKDPEPEAKPEK